GFLGGREVRPAAAEQVLLVAGGEPVGEPVLMWRAARQLGIGASAAAAAEAAGLVTISERVTFRHPLVRSAVYRAASPQERRTAHQALADATDPGLIRTAMPGTAPGRSWSPMRGLPPSWSGRRAGPRHVGAWPPRPRSWSGRPR